MAGMRAITWRRLIPVILIVVTIVITGFSLGDKYFRIARAMESFGEVFRAVHDLYVDEVNPGELSKKGMDEMLNTLDPYTNYYPEDMIEDARAGNLSGYGGIGAESRRFGTRTVITRVFERSPAARAGIRPGDEILKLDGIHLKDIAHEESGKLVRGQIGTTVKLEYLQPGKEIGQTVELKREQIKVRTVTHFGFCPPESGPDASKIGYIVLEQFGQESGAEVAEAVKELRKQGATSLILDVRGNPGGLLDEAVRICGLFIPKGKLVVTTRAKGDQKVVEYNTRQAPIEPEIPLAVLVNRSSASASEIVAGTLQDYDRAVIIGERSYGKGLVQTRRPLSYNGVIMVTTARYYTPSGRCIQVLDYSRRRADGSVASVPDSVKRAFRTTQGRAVYDGGGIDPDIVVKKAYHESLAELLEKYGYAVDFAAQYRGSRTAAPDPQGFQVDDATYRQFRSWLASLDLPLSKPISEALIASGRIAAENQLEGQWSKQSLAFRDELRRAQNRVWDQHENQIKKVLTQEIMRGYYLDKGAARAGYMFDADWQEAVQTLTNHVKYNALLKGKAP